MGNVFTMSHFIWALVGAALALFVIPWLMRMLGKRNG